MPTEPADARAWTRRLRALAEELRLATCGALRTALDEGRAADLARPAAQGVGDVTFGLDVPSEEALTRWLDEVAREGPLSLLTEDAGWRHRGPGPDGAPVDLGGFDHGGPRVAVDPVDGTRHLMTDLRPAWTCVAWCPPGPAAPRLSDVAAGVVAELPVTRAARHRALVAVDGACTLEECDSATGEVLDTRPLRADGDDRADHGYFPLFCYEAALRPDVARVGARFFERLEVEEGADPRVWYDDQYICNAGQLVHLAEGTYRMVADLRALLSARRGRAGITSKPYDLAGAVACARAAGCRVTDGDGEELDFPLDAETPVAWVGWHNDATRARLAPHLRAALAE